VSPVNEYGVGYSKDTQFKQDCVGKIFAADLSISRKVLDRHPRWHRNPVCVDLTAGCGVVNGADGSPLIMLETARRLGITVDAYLIEQNHAAVAELRTHLDQRGLQATVLAGDHTSRWADVERALGARARWSVGLVYLDLNGVEQPWDLLGRIAQVCPRLDLLLSLAPAYRKWHAAQGRDDGRLIERVSGIGKQHIVLRRPAGHGQWTLVLLSNTDFLTGHFRRQGFRPLGSPEGQAIAELLDLTEEERKARYQPRLPFGEAW
jgi:three-Cys-motif partner protein